MHPFAPLEPNVLTQQPQADQPTVRIVRVQRVPVQSRNCRYELECFAVFARELIDQFVFAHKRVVPHQALHVRLIDRVFAMHAVRRDPIFDKSERVSGQQLQVKKSILEKP